MASSAPSLFSGKGIASSPMLCASRETPPASRAKRTMEGENTALQPIARPEKDATVTLGRPCQHKRPTKSTPSEEYPSQYEETGITSSPRAAGPKATAIQARRNPEFDGTENEKELKRGYVKRIEAETRSFFHSGGRSCSDARGAESERQKPKSERIQALPSDGQQGTRPSENGKPNNQTIRVRQP